jgi:hypothetical protein
MLVASIGMAPDASDMVVVLQLAVLPSCSAYPVSMAFSIGRAYARVLPLPVGAQMHMSCAVLWPPARPLQTAACTGNSSTKPRWSSTAPRRAGCRPCTSVNGTPVPAEILSGTRIHGSTGWGAAAAPAVAAGAAAAPGCSCIFDCCTTVYTDVCETRCRICGHDRLGCPEVAQSSVRGVSGG